MTSSRLEDIDAELRDIAAKGAELERARAWLDDRRAILYAQRKIEQDRLVEDWRP